jgi:hypothetical protein
MYENGNGNGYVDDLKEVSELPPLGDIGMPWLTEKFAEMNKTEYCEFVKKKLAEIQDLIFPSKKELEILFKKELGKLTKPEKEEYEKYLPKLRRGAHLPEFMKQKIKSLQKQALKSLATISKQCTGKEVGLCSTCRSGYKYWVDPVTSKICACKK